MMKAFASLVARAACVTLVLAATATAAEKVDISFKRTEGEASTYDLDISLDVTSATGLGGQAEETSTTTSMQMAMDVVEHPDAGTLAVTFKDLMVSQKIKGGVGEITVDVSGSDVTVKRGSKAIIDTRNKVGVEMASGLIREFGFVGTEATLTVSADGSITKIEGADELKKFLSLEAGPGLFPLITPAEQPAVGESWKSQQQISKLKGLDLSGNPLNVVTTYKLKEVVDEDDRKLALIEVSSEIEEQAGLSGKVVGGTLDGTTVILPEVVRTATGIVRFDLATGTVIGSKIDISLSMRMEISGRDRQTIDSRLTGTGTITTRKR